MTREEIITLLEIVSAAYPHAKIKDANAMVSAWELTLGDYSAEAVYKATRLHLSVNKYFPSPSDIRDNIVRADIVYSVQDIKPAIESNTQSDLITINGKKYRRSEWEEYSEKYTDALSEFLGFGVPENDNAVFPEEPKPITDNFLPYEL